VAFSVAFSVAFNQSTTLHFLLVCATFSFFDPSLRAEQAHINQRFTLHQKKQMLVSKPLAPPTISSASPPQERTERAHFP